MAQYDSVTRPTLTMYITTVDYKRKDPVFWIQSWTNMTKYKHKERRFPRYYSELQKLDRHLVSTLDDVLLPVLPFCPQPHQDKEGTIVPRQWWLHLRSTLSYKTDSAHRKKHNNKYIHTPTSSPLSSSSDSSLYHSGGDAEGTNDSNIGPFREDSWDKDIQLWLHRVTSHPRAISNEGLREFVESEVGFRPQLKTIRRYKKLSGFNIREQDMDADFALSFDQLVAFGQELANVQQSMQNLVMRQALYSDAWLEVASSWISYGGREYHSLLFILYKQIGKGCQQLADLERSQELLLTETLAREIHYEIRNVEAAKTSLRHRLDAFTDYIASRKHTESCLRHVDRLKSSSNIDRDRVNDVIADLEQARSGEQLYFQRHQRIDRNLHEDLEYRYKRCVTNDMIAAMREYARGQLHLEKQKLDIWRTMQQHLV